MPKKIITISREFGSGGHTIGQCVAQKLGYDFYDEELIGKIVAETGFSEEFIKMAGEYATHTNSLLYSIAMSAMTGTGSAASNYNKVYAVQNKVIRDLAQKEYCVIVGRCADFILRERTDCLNVFIHADMASREKRVLERYGELKGKSIQQRLEEKDMKRKLYYGHYTGREWGIARNYHLALNSAELGMERCVRWISELAEARTE